MLRLRNYLRLVLALCVPPLVSSQLHAIDIKIEHAPVLTIVKLLRTQECAAVSFIEVPEKGDVSLNMQKATIAEVLAEISQQNPSYRSESIGGRDLLYPATSEFQLVIYRVEIQSKPRQVASKLYINLLRSEIPAFASLVPPVLFGDDRMPIYNDRVSLRPSGRVIEAFVDLLGQDATLYFEFIKARSGQPSLEFDRVRCMASPK